MIERPMKTENEGALDMDGENSAYIEQLYRTHYRALYVLAYAILRDRLSAEAAVQEGFVVACRKIGDLRHSEDPLRWLKSTVRHRALHILEEWRRTAALFTSLADLAPGVEPAELDSTDFELVELCKGAVSESELAFFLRIAKGETTFPEEAVRQGIQLPACYKRFERIRGRLQRVLGEG